MTLPEVLLWQALRHHATGLKFRRQHPAGDYVLDFYCASGRLAIEVDGDIHGSAEQSTHDQQRDRWLNRRNVRVLRTPASAILGDLAAVIAHIVASASPDQPLHRPAAGASPRSGEECTEFP